MVKDIVITGEGIVSAIGNDKEAVLRSLKEKRSGIGEIRYLCSEHHELPVGEVKVSNDEMKASLGIGDPYISRTTLMGIWAVKQALADANVHNALHDGNPLRIVLVSGTTVGGMDITEQFYDKLTKGEQDIDCLKTHDCGSTTKTIADYFKIFADYATISTACSSAANALVAGANMIKGGEADMVIAGGTEALSRFHLNGFNSLMILDKAACRPFDSTRAGLNLGEGAAYVVMESEELANGRKCPIHAYLAGYGNACDAYHQTASSENGEGAYLSMTKALRMARLRPSDIQYVNAHGTGTPNNDLSESNALKRVFSGNIPSVSSTKPFTGHTTSASGAIETVICILALREQFVPANLGWSHPMKGGIVPSQGEERRELSNILCNSFGFGGNDTSLILSRHRSPVVQDEFLKYDDDDIRVLAKVEIRSEEELSETSKYVKPLEARRMGKLMKSSLLSSLKALEACGVKVPDAIVTGTAWGCVENSEHLLEKMTAEGESMLKPTYFMQSTHNTISSNIAIRLQAHGYNVTYTQGDKSLEWCLRDARLLLRSGSCRTVLVGCHDETTPTFRNLMAKVGLRDLLPVHSIALVLKCGD